MLGACFGFRISSFVLPSLEAGILFTACSLSGAGRAWRGGVRPTGRGTTLARDAVEEQADLTEPVEIEEVIRPGWCLAFGRGGIVGAAHGDGGMVPVGESDDEIGVEPAADSDNFDLLPAERVMGMGDRDESRRRLG